MTDDQINAAIAEACGWTRVNARHRSGIAPNADYVGGEFIPNYCADLNAMHEAEQILKRMGPEYARWLLEIVSRDAGPGIFYAAGSFAHIKAKARQRAEAFLRTLGKWEDAK
jgi:hypothetical protein